MRDRRRQRIKEALRKQLLPGRMLKGDDFYMMAEFGKNGFVREPFAVLRQGKQVHVVHTRQFAQQMKGAVVGASIQRVGDVWIKGENTHTQCWLHQVRTVSR